MIRPIETLLIANRGEIAGRIQRTCRAMGIRTVAVYSDADRALPFVREADLALRLGTGPAGESYLAMEAVLAAALGNGVDAIHPGYGFLSENPAFSAACEERGLIFVGPPAEVIRVMGDKAEAKRRVAEAGVPVLPGWSGEAAGNKASEATLKKEAERIGYPVLLKALAGGGGRGIRQVNTPADLTPALASARREALAAFGDERMMLEKYLPEPRHVEFQVLGDIHGTVLHLFERECSVQRRHQKVVEETPSPALNPTLRTAMAEAAVRAAKSVGYVGAGTVEFLLNPEGAFHFLEMNTRLQVEHPVTEAVLGLDLVRLQIEVAEGRPLALRQEDLQPRGHAIECRLNAEDPAQDFLPGTGRLWALGFPTGEGLRVDAGFEAGNILSPYYDSLVAKLIAWGPDRVESLRRMGRMLAETRLAGPATNLDYLGAIVDHPAFRAGETTTRFLERHEAALQAPAVSPGLRAEQLLALAAVTAWETRERLRSAQTGPSFTLGAGLHHGGLAGRQRRTITLPSGVWNTACTAWTEPEGSLRVAAQWDALSATEGPTISAGRTGVLRERPAPHGQGRGGGHWGELELEGVVLPLWWFLRGERCWLNLRGVHVAAQVVDAAQGLRDGGVAEGRERLKAPLPGKVIQVCVKVGERVAEGQTVLVLEAMKMEHTLRAPFASIVKAVPFAEGAQVNREEVLVDLEPEGE